MDFEGEIKSNTIIVGYFNTPLSSMDRSSRQKVNKGTTSLNYTLDKMDLIDMYRTFHTKVAEYTFFSNAYGTFPKLDHMLVHKIGLNKFKAIEVI